MAKWMLICPHCSHRFPHSNVDPATAEQAQHDPFKILPKPKFANGETMFVRKIWLARSAHREVTRLARR